ncbi:hypothetical protein DB30_04458 [Enhygromyxa salina]|uniref:Uncharacterized protein n=1 Tax=Enhygromyxa salina TaxID=215803 RepID=A0A0C1ZFI0_9BACT|nr:hypothetical protein [Enhygromyxa salina]KIG16414.1 hypothetical protein DB30_04458 [Enhygromyxa salina]
MTHRSTYSKSLAFSLAPALTTALVFGLPALAGVLALATPSVSQATVQDSACRIHAVEALEKGEGGIPANLDFLADRLRAPEFARYREFRLIDTLDFKLELNKVVDHKFKSGHNVELTLLGEKDSKLELNTKLKRGSSNLVDMDFVVGSNQIMLIPVRRGDQTIIFAYQCKHR